MKLEVEITEDEIKSAIERKIRVAIIDETKGWNNERYIVDQVKKLWKETADNVIREEMAKTPAIREKVKVALEAKMRAQLTAQLTKLKGEKK